MEALRFTGSGSEYFKIWIVNILLTIITLGIYYPWAKVRNKRYFYGNTNLADRNFEYHATGKQLLVGFLLGVFFFAIYTFVTQVAPQFAGIFMLLFMLILPWLIWRSLMFNMKVTSFSNVHFSFKGTMKRSYVVFLGYPLLGFLLIVLIGALASTLIPGLQTMQTTGLNNPLVIAGIVFLAILVMGGYVYFIALIKMKSKEYTIGNSYYGQGAFSTRLELKKFLGIYFRAFGLFIVSLGVIGFLLSSMMSLIELIFITAYIGIFVIMLFVMAYVISRERAYVYENTLLDGKIAFQSTLSAREFAMVMFTNFLLIIVTLGLATPWAKVRVAQIMLANTLVDTSIGFEEYITQQQNNVGAIGEQVGEAFDVDVDVGF